jgi:tetratricopeptide (TPR) repeat protein
LAHVAAWTADANPASADLRAAAEQLSAHLPLSARAQLAATRVRLQLEADGDIRKAVANLEALGDGDLSHWRIWDYCFTLMLEDMEGFSVRDRLRVAEKGVEASPEHALALANLGATLLVLDSRNSAIAPLAKALELSAGDEPSHFYPAVIVNSFMAGGNQDDWHQWVRHFRRTLRRDRPGLRAQLRLTKRDLRNDDPPDNFGTWPY